MSKRLKISPRPALLACVAVAAMLAGCGDTPYLTIIGTAAKGDAVVGGAVSVSCARGIGDAVSDGQGGFVVIVANGEGPCLLKLTPVGGVPMYSFTTGTGSQMTANITPMTNLLVSYLSNVPGAAAATPEDWFRLPAVQSLLTVPAAVDQRVVGDFLPLLKSLATQGGQTLTLNSADFLRTPFTPGPSASPIDAALLALRAANVVTSTGVPTPAAQSALVTGASDDTPVPPTTTGTGGG